LRTLLVSFTSAYYSRAQSNAAVDALNVAKQQLLLALEPRVSIRLSGACQSECAFDITNEGTTLVQNVTVFRRSWLVDVKKILPVVEGNGGAKPWRSIAEIQPGDTFEIFAKPEELGDLLLGQDSILPAGKKRPPIIGLETLKVTYQRPVDRRQFTTSVRLEVGKDAKSGKVFVLELDHITIGPWAALRRLAEENEERDDRE
jgi:hypothetical protein